MDNLKPYPQYKDSGLAWLGKVPAHWDCLPHRTIFKEKKEQGHVEEPLLSVTISRGVIQQADLLTNSSKKDSSNMDKSKYKLVEPGDIAYNKMRAWQGAVGVSRHRGIVSPAYIVVRLRKADNPDYFHFLFRTPGFAKEAERWSYGITSDMWSLRAEHFKLIYSCVPSRSEQDSIVGFLRSFDVKVHHFIRNRRRIIEVLNEQKQAIINRAVICSIDPNVRLKPSGIEWLGDIPEHWEVVPIKRMFSNIDYGISESAHDEGRYQVLTMGNIRNGKVTVENCGRIDKVDPQLVLDHHDLLFNRTNSLELVAKVGLFEGVREDDITFASYLVRMKTNSSTFPKYANFLLNSSRILTFARLNAIPSLHQANLNPTRYGRLPVPLPPKKEQALLLNYISEHCEEVDKLLIKTQREIDLIREYRTRLISNIVTGKLDVRQLSLELGEELAEPVELDESFDNEEVLEDEALDLDEEMKDADD